MKWAATVGIVCSDIDYCSTMEYKTFTQKMESLINATGAYQKKAALAEILKIARNTVINYGYRVHNI